MTRQKKLDRNILLIFVGVPVLSSIISAIHLIRFVSLGNASFMAVLLAITFELGSIVSFVALSKNILQRLHKELLFSIFILLFVLQAFGNVYSSFDYMRLTLIKDPTLLDSFREMFFNSIDVTSAKLTLSLIIGLPIPLISLILLKSAIDYFTFGTDETSSVIETIPAIKSPTPEYIVTQFPDSEVKTNSKFPFALFRKAAPSEDVATPADKSVINKVEGASPETPAAIPAPEEKKK